MKVKSKVSKFTDDRKIVEIPTAVRDNFKIGEEVIIEKPSTPRSKPRKGKGGLKITQALNT